MTQQNLVLNHLRNNKHINTWTAFTEYGCTRLADIIFRLKKTALCLLIDTKHKHIPAENGETQLGY